MSRREDPGSTTHGWSPSSVDHDCLRAIELHRKCHHVFVGPAGSSILCQRRGSRVGYEGRANRRGFQLAPVAVEFKEPDQLVSWELTNGSPRRTASIAGKRSALAVAFEIYPFAPLLNAAVITSASLF